MAKKQKKQEKSGEATKDAVNPDNLDLLFNKSGNTLQIMIEGLIIVIRNITEV